jgi:hypothetical protein
MALPEGHKYRALADRSYRPKFASNDAQWELARPLLIQILAADPRRVDDRQRVLDIRRAVLARHLYWLAGDNPSQLNPDQALDELVIERSSMLSGRVKPRSRRVLLIQVRTFRAGFPDLFPPKVKIPPQSEVAPMPDGEFEIALSAADTFRNQPTRDYIRGLLLLCRGAGLGPADSQCIAGTDVFHLPGAGLWVKVRRLGHTRDVPVLLRYQSDLEQLAQKAGRKALIASAAPPTPFGRASLLAGLLKRRISSQHAGIDLSIARIRKAWAVEQLEGFIELDIFLKAAGLMSMHGLEGVREHCPSVPPDPVRDARVLGGLPPAGGVTVPVVRPRGGRS